MITERTLRRWRRDSLSLKDAAELTQDAKFTVTTEHIKEIHERILRLTQELLDQHLMRKA
jgi:hypothetical protein